MEVTIWDMISPPQWTAIFGALVALGIALILFGRWLLFDYFPKLLNNWLEADKEKRLNATEANRARLDMERLERQTEAQAQNANQEIVRILAAQLDQTHKDSVKTLAAMQDSFARREEQYLKHLASIDNSTQQGQVIAASTLELLKARTESDEVMGINQQLIKEQGEKTHQKMNELSSDLAAVLQKVESISENRVGDRRILDEVMAKLTEIKDSVKQLAERDLVIFDAPPPAPVVTISASVTDVTITQDTMDTPKKEGE